MFKAVIFDFDGVVADTMNDNFIAWNEAFAFYNVHLKPMDYFLLEGMGPLQVARFFINKYKLDSKIEQRVINAKEEHYLKKNKFKIYTEIRSLIKFLKNKKIHIALVTGASKERLIKTLPEEILKQISILVTADDVKKGKPDPESYLQAIKELKLNAQECLIIENSKLGIQSAKAAGATCFAIETTLSRNYLYEADKIFSNHLELNMYLMSLFD